MLSPAGRPEVGPVFRRMVEVHPSPEAYAEAVRTLQMLNDRAGADFLLRIARDKFPGDEDLESLAGPVEAASPFQEVVGPGFSVPAHWLLEHPSQTDMEPAVRLVFQRGILSICSRRARPQQRWSGRTAR